MGNLFSKTKNIENKFVSEIKPLNTGQLALLSDSEIEIISQDTLETNIPIKGDCFINLFQISNGNVLIFSKSKIQIISLKNNTEYNTIQEIENDCDIFYAKLFEIKEELFFIRQNYGNKNNNILFEIYNNTNSTIEKIDKKNEYSDDGTQKLIDAGYLIPKNEFIILVDNKLKLLDKITFKLNHEITENDFHLDRPPMNAMCILDDNYVLIGTHKNLYILNINNYEFVSIIRHDTIIRGVSNIKKNINGNIILTANNYYGMKGSYTMKDYLIVYKYNNNENKLEKIYDETISDRIRDFVCLNENKISFLLAYFTFFGGNETQYLKISNYNF